jgi:DNA polymerase I-like protein with 3'-5' exonuclease and polymerase domains
MRLYSLSIGSDGRNRTNIAPFGSKTGRNQPSNARFLFGTSRWLRGLIKPPPGRAIAYVDWVSQEIAIAAALSGDTVLWEAYASGDPYMAFAKQAGLAPPHATKATHKAERQRAKAIVLGVGYGMSPAAIATSAGLHIEEARDLLLRHKLTYSGFWEWATANQNAGLMGVELRTTFGWTWKAGMGTSVNPRSLLNWPMQAGGAEMMRLACCDLTENGIMVCCPVHDALLVEGPADDIDHVIAVTQTAMEAASELVLGAGRVVKTDVELVTYPCRYEDEAGIEMWNRTLALLEARGW